MGENKYNQTKNGGSRIRSVAIALDYVCFIESFKHLLNN